MQALLLCATSLIVTLLTIRSLLCATTTYYVQALLLCATTLMERATRVVRAAAAATPQGVTLPDSCFRSSLLALLPAACACHLVITPT